MVGATWEDASVARLAEICMGAAVIAAAAGMAANASSANADRRVKKDRHIVEKAAGRLDYQAISGAWAQSRQANPAPLEAITGSVRLRYVGAHEQAGGIVTLTFGAHRATCLDLISSPIANTVRSRPGC
jgi:hypothetical protein